MIKNRFLFYLLSLTWGLPMTLIGFIVATALWTVGLKHKERGYCYCFEIGNNWGGVNLGMVCITSKNPSQSVIAHECGHSQQNCLFGPFIIIISIMSFVRYWYREIRNIINKPCNTGYYNIWFEKQADEFGENFFAWYENNTK